MDLSHTPSPITCKNKVVSTTYAASNTSRFHCNFNGALTDSIVDIEKIQDKLDGHISDLSNGWKASIPFLCSIVYDVNKIHTNLPSNISLTEINNCDYLGGNNYPASMLVFSPTTYKPPSSNDEMPSKESSKQCIG